MEKGVAANAIGLLLQNAAALALDCLQGRQIVEPPIGQRFIGERPEALSRLQFGRIGRQKEEMDALRDTDLLAGVPAGAIEHQQDVLLRSRSNLPRKRGQHLSKERGRHRGEQPPDRLAGRGTDEATDIEPLVSLPDGSDGTLPDRCPDPTDQRQEANTMLIGGPEFDRRRRMGVPDRGNLTRQIFF